MQKLYLFIGLIILSASCADEDQKKKESSASVNSKNVAVDFWNGNRSETRQLYERDVLEEIYVATEDEFGGWQINENLDEYPGDEESLVFKEKGHHLFVTIAGNQKFEDGDMIVIEKPLTKNLLGYRIPIIRQQDSTLFNNIETAEDIKELKHGIPVSWSDAKIFEQNGYSVAEEGTFDDIFERLHSGNFDYSAYGANEVQGIFRNRASLQSDLMIDRNIMLFYPFPLVFYVNPDMPDLADRIEIGLDIISQNGTLDSLFNTYYSNIVEELNLDKRKIFTLENPYLPQEFEGLSPDVSKF